MKKTFSFFIFAAISFFIQKAHTSGLSGAFDNAAAFETARAIKLGAGEGLQAYNLLSGVADKNAEQGLIAKECAKNCITCDTKTGTCAQCGSGYMLSENACAACPPNAICNGFAGFSCQTGYVVSGPRCVLPENFEKNENCIKGCGPLFFYSEKGVPISNGGGATYLICRAYPVHCGLDGSGCDRITTWVQFHAPTPYACLQGR